MGNLVNDFPVDQAHIRAHCGVGWKNEMNKVYEDLSRDQRRKQNFWTVEHQHNITNKDRVVPAGYALIHQKN